MPASSSRRSGGPSEASVADVAEQSPLDREPYLDLTTSGRRSGQPREVQLWFTRWDGRDYVIAESGRTAQWVRNLLVDPRVGWRVGALTVTGRARIVDRESERALHDAVRTLFEAKYGWGDGLIVELMPDPPDDPVAETLD